MDTLYIDSNEPQKVQTTVELTIQDRDTDAQTEIKGLKTADFIYKDVAIERKEASDLASSIKDGRLEEQTLRMLEDFEHQYIIVEGNPYNLKHSNLHKHAFVGTMVSRSSEGIGIIYTPDVEATAYALNKIISKHEEGERKVKELKRTKADTEDVQVAMLTCVKGVSKEKAEKILEQHDWDVLVKNIVDDATRHIVINNLQEIEGVGPTLSKRIVEAFI